MLLKLCMSAIDLVIALFLVLGGLAAISSHPIPGFISLVMAPFLIFLSIGVWTASRKQLAIHAVLYWGAFGVFGITVGVVAVAGALHNSEDKWVAFGITVVFLIAGLLSTIQLRHLSTRSSSRH